MPEDLPEGVLAGHDSGSEPDEESVATETTKDGFVYFRMTGGRFETGKGMPASAAAEIQRYSELLYEVARLEWLAAHPGRSNATGLKDAFDLRLVGIEDGSARVQFQLTPRSQAGDASEPEILFMRARDIINETIAMVAVDGVLPEVFPRRALPHLGRVGRMLGDGEAIALAKPRAQGEAAEPSTDAVLTRDVQRTVRQIDEALEDKPEWFEAEGVINEFDPAKGTFRLKLTAGGTVKCHLGTLELQVAETVRTVLAVDRESVTAPDVVVAGVPDWRPNGDLAQLLQVNEVTVVRTPTEKVLMARLDELSSLEPEWSGPGARAPGAAAIRCARELVPALARSNLPVAVGAVGDGSVVLEWRRETTVCSAELQADGDMYLFADHTDSDTYEEYEGAFDAVLVIRFVDTGALDG